MSGAIVTGPAFGRTAFPFGGGDWNTPSCVSSTCASSSMWARRMLHGERKLGAVRNATVYSSRERRRQLVVGMRRGWVVFMAVARPKLSKRAVIADLR